MDHYHARLRNLRWLESCLQGSWMHHNPHSRQRECRPLRQNLVAPFRDVFRLVRGRICGD
jgi:hypothetical protein